MFHESVCVGPNRQLNYELKTYERAHLSHEWCFLKINIANPAEFQLLAQNRTSIFLSACMSPATPFVY